MVKGTRNIPDKLYIRNTPGLLLATPIQGWRYWFMGL